MGLNPALARVTLKSTLLYIGAYAFEGIGLNSITLPESLVTISKFAFTSSFLTSVSIPDETTTIGQQAFENCAQLTSVTIGRGCEAIGSSAFKGCGVLATINCYATAAPTLASTVFVGCLATQIHVPIGATEYGTTYGGLTVVYDLDSSIVTNTAYTSTGGVKATSTSVYLPDNWVRNDTSVTHLKARTLTRSHCQSRLKLLRIPLSRSIAE
jgi:hypothetical protein